MLYVSSLDERHPITSLADYVRRIRNEKNFSLAQVSARSHGRIGKTHINRIENGTVARVSLLKLRALALGLGVAEDDLIAVAQGKPPRTKTTKNEAKLLSYFRRLSVEEQEEALLMLQAYIRRLRAKANKRQVNLQ